MRFHIPLGLASPFAAAVLLLSCAPLWAGNHTHTQTVKNNTGAAANDLHVNLIHNSTGTPTAPPFTTATPGAFAIDFSGGSVPNGGSSTVTWKSAFASDTLDPTNPGNWTFNGASVGVVASAARFVQPQLTPLGGNQYQAALVNSGTAVTYTDLALVTGANAAFFSESQYISGMSSGTPVSLLVPTSGQLPQGVTPIALFTASNSAGLYDAGRIMIGGELNGQGGMVPEPGAVALLGFIAAAVATRRRRAPSRHD